MSLLPSGLLGVVPCRVGVSTLSFGDTSGLIAVGGFVFQSATLLLMLMTVCRYGVLTVVTMCVITRTVCVSV